MNVRGLEKIQSDAALYKEIAIVFVRDWRRTILTDSVNENVSPALS